MSQPGNAVGFSNATYCWWPCTGSEANGGVGTSLAAPAGINEDIVLGEEDMQSPTKIPFD